MSAPSLRYSESGAVIASWRPSTGLSALRESIARKVFLNAFRYRCRDIRHKRHAGNLLVDGDVAVCELRHQLFRSLRKSVVLVGVAVLFEPQPQEFLVEELRLFPFRKSLSIASRLPITRRIRRVDLVDKCELPVRVETEFILGIDKDESPPRGYLLTALKKRKRDPLDVRNRFLVENAFGNDLLGRERPVVEIGFGRRREDGSFQLLILLHPLRQGEIAEIALAVLVERPKRGVGNAGDVAAHDRLNRKRCTLLPHDHVRVRNLLHVILHDIFRRIEPERAYLVQYLSFERDVGDVAVERGMPVGRDENEFLRLCIHVAHLSLETLAELRKIRFLKHVVDMFFDK